MQTQIHIRIFTYAHNTLTRVYRIVWHGVAHRMLSIGGICYCFWIWLKFTRCELSLSTNPIKPRCLVMQTHTHKHTNIHAHEQCGFNALENTSTSPHLSTHKSLYCEWIYTYNTKAWPICVLLSLFFLSLQHRAKRRALLEHGASDIVVASCSRRHPCASCEYSVCSVQHAACSMYSMWAQGLPLCVRVHCYGSGGETVYRIPHTVYGIVIRGI